MKKYITSDPQILGGAPVIKGTRIPASRILFLLKDGYTVELIHEQYPHVDTKTISGAIDEMAVIINKNHNAPLL